MRVNTQRVQHIVSVRAMLACKVVLPVPWLIVVVALVMLVESLYLILNPQTIQFNAAIGVAALGLFVNIVSAFLLKDNHEHTHDHNLKGAYLHVFVDAVTSLLAIVALLSGKYFRWNWRDPIMGIVGAVRHVASIVVHFLVSGIAPSNEGIPARFKNPA